MDINGGFFTPINGRNGFAWGLRHPYDSGVVVVMCPYSSLTRDVAHPGEPMDFLFGPQAFCGQTSPDSAAATAFSGSMTRGKTVAAVVDVSDMSPGLYARNASCKKLQTVSYFFGSGKQILK